VRRDVARNRALLLAAADVAFRERGAATTLDDIARQAGVGVATAYRHFANKQALVDALLEDRLQRAEGILDEAETIPDPRSALEHFLYSVCELQANDRGMREAIGGEYDASRRAHVDHFLPRVLALAEAAQRSGVLRAEFSASDLGPLLWMVGALSDRAGGVAPELWRRYLAFFIDGLLAEGIERSSGLVDPLSLDEAVSVASPICEPGDL
jgi:AcrR family transcriptional regulator